MMSVCLLLLFIWMASVRASLVNFEASPATLKTNLTETMGMGCAVSDNNNEDVKHIVSIFITNSGGHDVASVTTFDAPVALTDFGNLAAKGSLSATSGEGDLQLSWADAGLVTLGDYKCQVTAVDAKGHTIVLTSSLTMTSEPPSIGDVISAFNAKFLTQQEDIKRLTQENSQQATKISKLESCASKHVAFNAGLSQSKFNKDQLSLSPKQTIVWDMVTLNQGGDYSASSGMFRCTVPGVYVFHVHMMANGTNEVCLQLEINGNVFADVYKIGDQIDDASLSHVTELQAGDTVVVKEDGCPSSVLRQWGDDRYNYFMGHLLSATDCTV